MGKKGDLSDFERGMVVGAQWWSVTKYNYFVTVLK